MKIFKNELDTQTKEIAESLLFNGNGFIGIRNIFDEWYYDDYQSNRHTYLNGFFDTYDIDYPETYYGAAKTGEQMIPVIDGQTTLIKVGGDTFNLHQCDIKAHTRYLDIATGESVRSVEFITENRYHTKVCISKIASFEHKNLVITNYQFTKINHDQPIELQTHINFSSANIEDINDPRIAKLEGQIKVETVNPDNKTVLFSTSNSNINCYFQWSTSAKEQIDVSANQIIINAQIDDQYTKAYTHSLEGFVTPITDYKQIQMSQKNYLDKFWNKAKIKIIAQDDLEESINYGTFALLQSVGTNKSTSIAAKGLSGIGYEGHVFWDAEMYIFPVFLKINPEIARSMIEYRIKMYNAAKQNRQLVGYHQGILFPWRTISGRECSAFFEAGMAQHHINLDITFAILEYVKTTGDTEILLNGGFEVLFGVIEMFASLVHKQGDKYHLDKVTGPDEYTALVDDNYYTNIMLKHTIESTIDLYNQQDSYTASGDLEHYCQIAKMINLPYDEKRKILAQDRDFLNKGLWPQEEMKHPLLLNYHPLYIYRYQVCKQADVVLACQLFDDYLSSSVIENTIDYYDKITTHDSSLSYSSFATVYARLNQDKAYTYFLENARLDLDNTHNNTRDGVHTASMGGTYQTVIDGFAGYKIVDGKPTFTNNLPKQISYLEFKVMYKMETYKVIIETGKEPVINKEI